MGINIVFLTIANDPRGFRILTKDWTIDDLPALPEILCVGGTCVEPLGVILVVVERGNKLGELNSFGATLQHGAHHGRQPFIPAVITHGYPTAVAVNFHSPRTAVKTPGQPDSSHLCTQSM